MFFLILSWVIILAIVGTLAWIPYYKWRDSHIPFLKGPYNYPFLGILYHFKDTKNLFKKMTEFHNEYGKNYRGYFMNELNIITKDVDLIEFAVTSNKTIDKGTAYRYLNNWLATGLLTSGGDKWRKRRKMITPAYHFKILDQFIEMFDRNGNIMVQKLRGEVDKPETNIFPFVNLCALDTICETAMGTQVNAQLSADSEFVQATKEMNRIVMVRGFDFFKAMDWSYQFTEDYQKEKQALKVLHGYTMKLIKSRRNELLKLQAEQQNNKDGDEFETKRKDNFLDLLLKSSINGQPLSNEDIQEEVDTFMFEGHDTVSSAISFALYLISNHPEVQKQLIEEQRHIFGSNPHRPTTLADLQEMKYLELVIKETLRIYPSVPMIVREVTEDLTYSDWNLCKGTQIVIYTYELHRDPAVFPDPEEFRPERFLPSNIQGRNPFAYIPFSAGHRNCIGQKFANLEMKSTISKVVRNYELLPLVPKHTPFILSEVILRSDNGVMLKLKNRVW